MANKKLNLDKIEKKVIKSKNKSTSSSYDTYYIGLGGTGNNLLHELSKNGNLIDNPEKQAYYVNFSKTDLSSSFKGKKLLLHSRNGEGTGKSLEKGKEIVKENLKNITEFCEFIYKNGYREDLSEKRLIIISSLGGGTGSSLLPVFLDYFSEFSNIKITFFGIVSSRSEGVTTLPNALRNFESVYNNYALTNKLNSVVLLDNEIFEAEEAFDYSYINSEMRKVIENILDTGFSEKSSEGMQALDLNEKKRVMYFGKGLTDYFEKEISLKNKDEFEFISKIMNHKFDLKKGKAVSALFEIREKHDNFSEVMRKETIKIINKIKKTIPDAFFVFGYTFDNKLLPKTADFRVSVTVNGLEFPKTIEKDVKKAAGSVEKIKRVNNSLQIEDDLSF